MLCGAVRCCAVLCGAVLCGAVRCFAMLCCAVLCCAVRCYAFHLPLFVPTCVARTFTEVSCSYARQGWICRSHGRCSHTRLLYTHAPNPASPWAESQALMERVLEVATLPSPRPCPHLSPPRAYGGLPPAIDPDGWVYVVYNVVFGSGAVSKLDPHDGSQVWTYSMDDAPTRGPVLTGDGLLYVLVVLRVALWHGNLGSRFSAGRAGRTRALPSTRNIVRGSLLVCGVCRLGSDIVRFPHRGVFQWVLFCVLL